MNLNSQLQIRYKNKKGELEWIKAWLKNFLFLLLCLCLENERRIRANDREYNSQFHYAVRTKSISLNYQPCLIVTFFHPQNNYIKTSKYSFLTFLPLNLLEQFQRLANFYFLCLLILQLIPAITSLTPVTTAIPLIGVLSLTAIKDAYDDFQRHINDSQVNNRISKCLRNGKLMDEKWSGVQVRFNELNNFIFDCFLIILMSVIYEEYCVILTYFLNLNIFWKIIVIFY